MNATCLVLSRLTGKLSVLSATFLLALYKIADVETLTKNFRDEMVEQLIDFLQAYKIEMEFKGLDFDGDADKWTQYTRHS